MTMQLVLPPMSTPVERAGVARGEAAGDPVSEETSGPRHANEHTGSALLQAALTRENLQVALKRVRANKGAAGMDGMDIAQTVRHLLTAWPGIRAALLQVLQPLACAGRVAATSGAGHPTKTVEAWQDHVPGTTRNGRERKHCTSGGGQQPLLVAKQLKVAQ